jgi:hypothetical protein
MRAYNCSSQVYCKAVQYHLAVIHMGEAELTGWRISASRESRKRGCHIYLEHCYQHWALKRARCLSIPPQNEFIATLTLTGEEIL